MVIAKPAGAPAIRASGWLLLACGICAVAQAAGISAIDDRGARVTLPSPALRIVALAPSITELVFAAGAGDKLVGAARFSDYPAAAGAITQIGDASRIDLERVLSLKPDLVLAWKSGNHAADFARLEQLGFAVFVAEPARLTDIPRLLRILGKLGGSTDAAEQSAGQFERGIARLAAHYRARGRVRVFYEIWHQPLMTVNGRHMISDVITLCGGSNVFSAAPILTPLVSLESVIAAQPDVVLGGSSATTPREFAAPWLRDARYAGLGHLRAMYVAPDTIQRQTPRILQGAEAVCEHLEAVRSARTVGTR
ncbi:MAG: cobalamin-binding protein [Burkholderiales bacterium]